MEVDMTDTFRDEMEGIDWESSFETEMKMPEPVVVKKKEVADPVDVFYENQNRYVIVSRLTSFKDRFSVYVMKGEICGKEGKLELHDLWNQDIILDAGMIVNIVDVEPDAENTFVINRNGGFLIVEPDLLLPITSIMSQMWCERKAAFSEIFKLPRSNLDALRGTIAHDIIGRAMVDRVSDLCAISRLAKLCTSSLAIKNSAYGCKLSQAELEKLTEELLPFIQDFLTNRFFRCPKDQGVQFLDVCDIEDTYWNPAVGMKGKLDAMVRVKYKNGEKVVPLEFKTGQFRNHGKQVVRPDHTGQVSLYTLLVRPRYGIGDSGLLLYIRENFLKEHKVPPIELQHLVHMRNRLAISTLPQAGQLKLPRPDGVDFDFKCGRCEYQHICGAMLMEKRTELLSLTGTETKLLAAASYLLPEDLDFFRKWFDVITFEIENENKVGTMSLLWKTRAFDREKKGICVSGLKLMSMSPFEVLDSNGNRCYQVTLTKSSFSHFMGKTLFLEKDLIILSTQYEVCIAYGCIETITDNSLTLTVERRLNELCQQPHILFSIDKIASVAALQLQYSYLCKLMGATEEARRLRDYIIRKTPPKFSKLKLEDHASESFLRLYNEDQQKVFRKALQTDSFLFVKGMPGTGKTETIVGLLQILVKQKFTVLVVAYTKNAVDNILVRYKRYCEDFLRVGEGSRFSQVELKDFSVTEIAKRARDLDELTREYNMRAIVGSTLLSLKHEIFSQRIFDYCIVDEASQALPPSVLGSLMLARKYIMFGDPDQLPAIIRSDRVKQMNIEDSMFTLACQPVNTVKLSIQYRMNSIIMDLANKLVYKGQMSCGGEVLSESFLDLPTSVLKNHVYRLPKKMQRWISSVLSKKLIKSVVFLETSSMNAIDEKIGDTVRNVHEAQIVKSCVQSFVECGCQGANIGVIAPFRGQVSHVQQMLAAMGNQYESVEVNTVDQYQGRDKDIIICTFTKSKTFFAEAKPFHQAVGDAESKQSILDDIRRLNVAVTRAKKKLIMIGNAKTLQQFPPFQKLFTHLENEQLVIMNSDITAGVLGA